MAQVGLQGCQCTSDLQLLYSMDSSALHAAFVVLKAHATPQNAYTGNSGRTATFAVSPAVTAKTLLMVVRDDVPQILNTNYTLVDGTYGNPAGPYNQVTLILKDSDPPNPGLYTGETLDFYLIEPGVFMPIRYTGDMIVGDSVGSPSRLSISTTHGDVLTNVSGVPAWATGPGVRTGIGTLVDGRAVITDSKIGATSQVGVLWAPSGIYRTPIHELVSARSNGVSFTVVSS